MRKSSSGWGEKDFDKLLTGFNFNCRQGRHRIYTHAKYNDLTVVIPRKKEQRNYLVPQVLKKIDELIKREAKDKDDDDKD